MPATVFGPEDGLFDPDDLKMPESPDHRRAIDAIGLAATSLLGNGYDVFRDMNWYPPDGGNAMAPDVMILPAGAFVHPPDVVGSPPSSTRLKSYRQDKTGGPPPVAVVEVPSDTDSYASLRAKTQRCRALGTPVYIVVIDEPRVVERLVPGETGSEDWIDKPIPELGGLCLTFHDDVLTVVTPDGVAAGSDHDLLRHIERRAAELERRLREAGIDPDVP